jgi:hypothetical protein
MPQSPLIRWTNELMAITEDLDQERAAAFVRQVLDAGRQLGREEAARESPPTRGE